MDSDVREILLSDAKRLIGQIQAFQSLCQELSIAVEDPLFTELDWAYTHVENFRDMVAAAKEEAPE